jgi:hypothetical protein
LASAAATISASPSVVFNAASPPGTSQCASANSSLSETTPEIQRAANGKMPLDPAGAVPRDGLAKAGERDRLDLKCGLFANLAHNRLFKRFTEFDAAAGQRIEPVRGRTSTAHDQHVAVAEDRGAHREKRPRWISPGVAGVAH